MVGGLSGDGDVDVDVDVDGVETRRDETILGREEGEEY